MTRFAPLAVLALAVLVAAGGPALPVESGDRAEVVVLLDSPPLAHAPRSRAEIAREQRAFRDDLAERIPDAEVGWRYRLVANGFSLTLPSADVERLRALHGVRDVLAAGSYVPQLTTSPQQIGAPALWGQALDTAGQGMKIGIIDSGIDPGHPFFEPAGYAMPAGFPRGQQRFTTAKIIVARVFAPKGSTAASARVAYSDDDSSHGTHVAGIAAGNAETTAGNGRRVSGVAPRAYLGNYKVFVETSAGLSPNANSPAIVAAIEGAVADGMNVINFSGGEPEIEPSRDIVALALDAAAAAGVVPVVAAGNDYNDLGAGAAALLRQRHPSWSVDQLRSALVQSGADSTQGGTRAAGPRFQGGGVIALQRADRPLVFAQPTALSFGLLGRGQTGTGALALTDAGGGAGTWDVARIVRGAPGGLRFTGPATVTVPGQLEVVITVPRGARAGDLDAYIELRRGAEARRIPVWARVTAASLARHKAGTLARPGIYRSTTAGRPSVVSRYRYPETPRGIGVTTVLNGPERVFRFRIAKAVANAGVVVTQLGRRSIVEPRIVAGVDENRLAGYAGLPVNHNPYMDEFREGVGAAAVLSPARGDYAVVFDSATRAGAGAFTFRFWVNDVTPPTVRLRTRNVARGTPLGVSLVDAGSGIYPQSIRVFVDGSSTRATLRGGLLSIPTGSLGAGAHRLRVRASDFQESKNTENVARILPNTRWMTARFTVR